MFVNVPGMETKHAKSQVDSLAAAIRKDIVAGALRPGSRLRLQDLQQRYSVSAIPIREALSRLVSLGLVHVEAQKGFSVTRVSCDDMLDLFKTMISVEAINLRSSIAFGDRDWEAGIIAAAHRLGVQSGSNSNPSFFDDEWEELHRRFHLSLVCASRSERLLRYRELLFENVDRYRRIAALYELGDRDVDGEHRELMEAVLGRDAEKSIRAMCRHLVTTAKVLLSCEIEESDVVNRKIDVILDEISLSIGVRLDGL